MSERPREWNEACEDIRMNAYYFGFEGTGERAIDLILSAVAEAGKAYHHTEYWSDDEDGPSYADRIQQAADAAAEEMRLRR